MQKLKVILILFVFILSGNILNATSSNTTLFIDGAKEKVDLSKLKNNNYKKIVIKNSALRAIPKEIYNNKQLEYLDLSNTNIKNVDKEINVLTKLKTLILRNNQIKDINKITKLNSLEYLDVSGNNINVVKSLSKSTNLKHLDLSYNAINSISNLNEATKLKYLDLSNNQLLGLPKLPNKITTINLDENYLNIKNNCCTQYKNKVKNQNKILVKEKVTRDQVYYVMNHSEYTNQLLISTNSKSVVEFRKYVLKFKVADEVYSIKKFTEKYKGEKNVNFSILVDVITHSNNNYIAYGNETYQYTGDYMTVQNQPPSDVGFVPVSSDTENEKKETKKEDNPVVSSPVLVNNDDNYFNNSSFKTLSYVICLVFLIPLIMLCIIFLYLNKMNNDADKILQNG